MARPPALTPRCANPGAGIRPGWWRSASRKLTKGSTTGSRQTRRHRGCAQGNPVIVPPPSSRMRSDCRMPCSYRSSAVWNSEELRTTGRTATTRPPLHQPRNNPFAHAFSTLGGPVGDVARPWFGSANIGNWKSQVTVNLQPPGTPSGQAALQGTSRSPCGVRCSPREPGALFDGARHLTTLHRSGGYGSLLRVSRRGSTRAPACPNVQE